MSESMHSAKLELGFSKDKQQQFPNSCRHSIGIYNTFLIDEAFAATEEPDFFVPLVAY